MKNFVQRGDVLTAIAPAGGIASGAGLLAGALFGVAATSAEAGREFELALVGVFDLPKKAADAIALGARVYWDATAKQITTTATDNTLVGAASEPAGAGATKVRVRLNGISVPA